MDKEIIIDRVDVSGCCQFVESEHLCRLGGECKGWDNCYYKQLKRLQQENAELKVNNKILQETLDEVKSEYKRVTGNYIKLLQEIKDCLNTLSGIDNDFVNTETYLRILDLITKAEEE